MQTSQYRLRKLQHIQNHTCRPLLLASCDTHITDMHPDLILQYLSTRCSIHCQLLNHRNIYFAYQASLSGLFVPVRPVVGRRTRQITEEKMQVK